LGILSFDNLVKSLQIVMPNPVPGKGQALIRHQECIKFTGFRLSPEWRKRKFFDFLRVHQVFEGSDWDR